MEAQRSLESPRIRLLQQALLSGNTVALGTFWQEIMVEGVPLIEAIEGDPDHHLVTFLWRERAETQKVVIWGGPAGLDHPENNQMSHLLNTDLWYKTYAVQTEVRGVYSFTVDDTVTITGDERTDGSLFFLIDPLNPKVSHEDAKADVILSLLELPDAPPQPWCVPHSETKKGQLELHNIQSQILNAERRFWVYTPTDYQTCADPYGLLGPRVLTERKTTLRNLPFS